MKTLDEVIKALEEMVFLTDADSESEGYYLAMDSIHYLKEYQLAQNLCKLGNDPLTWSELREMEGKPVWIKWAMVDEWLLIDCINDEYMVVRACNGAGEYLWQEHMGKTWQAYRKENLRNENAG